MSDRETAFAMRLAHLLRITIHVRRNGVVEFKCKATRKVVGGTELKRRMAALKEYVEMTQETKP